MIFVPKAGKMHKDIELLGTLYPQNAVIYFNFCQPLILKSLWPLFSGMFYANTSMSQPLPDFQWKLEAGDTLILDKPCKKATCSYAGRNYVAWYTEEVNLPYGPYIFGGLPGLIIYLHDTKI